MHLQKINTAVIKLWGLHHNNSAKVERNSTNSVVVPQGKKQSVARHQIGFRKIAEEPMPKNAAAALCLLFCDGIYITQHDIILAETQI